MRHCYSSLQLIINFQNAHKTLFQSTVDIYTFKTRTKHTKNCEGSHSVRLLRPAVAIMEDNMQLAPCTRYMYSARRIVMQQKIQRTPGGRRPCKARHVMTFRRNAVLQLVWHGDLKMSVEWILDYSVSNQRMQMKEIYSKKPETCRVSVQLF